MTKDEFVLIETVLHAFPEICKAADMRREYLIAMATSPNPGDHVQGGDGVTSVERFSNGDKELVFLEKIVERVSGVLKKLRAEERTFVQKFYFENTSSYDFDTSTSITYKKRRAICLKLFAVIQAYSWVRTWRDGENERKLEAIRRRE